MSHVDSHNYLEEIKATYEWVRDNIRYVRDIRGVETLQLPPITLPRDISPEYGIGAGDCDDHVILLATLLSAIGVKDLSMRLVRFSPDDIEWKHIYLVVKVKGVEYAMDAIVKNQDFGYEVKYYDKKDIAVR